MDKGRARSAFRHVCGYSSAPVDQTLDDRHLCLLELLLGITAGGVREVDSMADLDVVGEGDVLDFDTRYKRTDKDNTFRSIFIVRRSNTSEARTPGCPTCRRA